MSEAHLCQLRNELEELGLIFLNEDNCQEAGVSAKWSFFNRRTNKYLTLVFEGIDDLNTLPIEQSYGCHIEDDDNIELYFAKINKSWKPRLDEFVKKIYLMK